MKRKRKQDSSKRRRVGNPESTTSVLAERLRMSGRLLAMSRVYQISLIALPLLVALWILAGAERLAWYGTHILLSACAIETARLAPRLQAWAKTARPLNLRLRWLPTVVVIGVVIFCTFSAFAVIAALVGD